MGFGQHSIPTRRVCRLLRRARPTPIRQRRQPSNAVWVWAPPRSLAATKGILSFPRSTEMFQFPRCPPDISGAQQNAGRVAPFGHPRITGCQRLPGAFRRVAASFFGRRRQGIHHAPIIAATLSQSSIDPRSTKAREPDRRALEGPKILRSPSVRAHARCQRLGSDPRR